MSGEFWGPARSSAKQADIGVDPALEGLRSAPCVQEGLRGRRDDLPGSIQFLATLTQILTRWYNSVDRESSDDGLTSRSMAQVIVAPRRQQGNTTRAECQNTWARVFCLV